ncbi:MAG: tRNA lysidine(34) synthetase TilS [Planctomycetota bacterium]|nr:tRNA lysidine(34) synthetase TilS [Planctomycetota bacterium]MDI6787939.1 tRNA lysidine(34) synthetase TilS [Planctomycetota bacterium]
MDFIGRVYNTIKNLELFQPHQIIIIGVSGGPDSVALLSTLKEINRRYKMDWHIVLAHLNHQLRGKKSDKDEQFVRELAGQLGLSVYVTAKNILKLSKRQNQSIEETARSERYHYFERVANRFATLTARKLKRRKNISIAVAHNLDDNAETVLFRIIRGTGLKGLRGIVPKRELFRGEGGGSPFHLVRPLLFIPRQEILSYLKKEKISYRLDASNRSNKMLRNRIRHQLLPLLRKYNPAILQHLVQLSETASVHYDYLDKIVRLKMPSKSLSLDLKTLKTEHPAIQIEIINRTLENNIKGATKEMTFNHFHALSKLINSNKTNAEIHLPDKIIARKEKEKIIIEHRA